ncbi:Transcription factor 21 [Schistosoma japonicum]|nr:Transcription factor 21 [Schistosoma japonicum]
MRMTARVKSHTSNNSDIVITTNNINYNNTLLITPNGKRRGRKPGLNSTVAQRSAANARERSRMRVLSGAFVELKGALPWVPKDTKLSKLDTLKLAAGYIAYLRRILDTSESHTPSRTPSTEIPEESGLVKTPSSLKLLSNKPNFELNSNLHDSTLSDTIKLFNLVTTNSDLKNHRTGGYAKCSHKHEKCDEEEEEDEEVEEDFLPHLRYNQQQQPYSPDQLSDQHYSRLDHYMNSHQQRNIPYTINHQYNHPPSSLTHNKNLVNDINCLKFNSLSTSISPSPTAPILQPTTDVEFPINKSMNETYNNISNICHVGHINNDYLSVKNNPSIVYPEFYPNQYDLKTSLSSYVDNIYEETPNTTNHITYSSNYQSLDEDRLQSLIDHLNERNYEDSDILKLKNRFYPNLTRLIKPSITTSLTPDKSSLNETVFLKSGVAQENSTIPQSMCMTYCMKQYQKIDTDSSLSSSSSAETSGSEINDDSILPTKTNNCLSNHCSSRQINNNV